MRTPSDTEDFARILRMDADSFVMTVAVIAAREGRAPGEVALEAMSDALARLTESGALGEDEE